tara:strand:+ start:444 stop:1064 length:621 start_codon:yes stop_codon:yes gene_type:complete
MMFSRKCYVNYILFCFILCLAACTTAPPDNALNACQIFEQYPNWYWAAKDSQDKWGVPVSVQLAIIFQESSFNANAKPPRGKLLWVIPWKRPTSAEGYTQAIDETWDNYIRHSGNTSASRNNFKDATDFIGWYGYQAHRRAGVPRNNAYDLYLAYHEGIGGYAKGTYKNKKWLENIAHKVQVNSWRYDSQLKTCASKFKKPWWHVW